MPTHQLHRRLALRRPDTPALAVGVYTEPAPLPGTQALLAVDDAGARLCAIQMTEDFHRYLVSVGAIERLERLVLAYVGSTAGAPDATAPGALRPIGLAGASARGD